MDQNIKDRPNVFPLPPVLVLVLLLLAFGLRTLAPPLSLNFSSSLWMQILGGALIIVAVGLDIWVGLIFRKARTNIDPTKPAETLVSSGPFAFSRNPIYLGNLFILVGAGLMSGMAILFFMTPIAALILQEFQIKREEAHLEARFADAWRAYKADVPRWI